MSTHLVLSLNAGFTDIDSADVILASDDQILFLAHRCVLCASSLVLKYLLLDNFSPTYVIGNTIEDIKISEIHAKNVSFLNPLTRNISNQKKHRDCKHEGVEYSCTYCK